MALYDTERVKSILVTGVDGFVGRHLAAGAHAKGIKVHGVARREASRSLRACLDSYHQADLTRSWPSDLPECDAIVHLAAKSSVGASFRDPQGYIADNSAMVTNMCEGLLASGRTTRVLLASSGAIYGSRNGEGPRDETAQVGVSSPYVVSKLLVENQMQYYASRGVSIVIARPFNHIGPGQGPGFIVPDLAERMLRLVEGRALPVGNLETRRDYTDVRDVAEAYLRLAALDEPEGIFNIASGRSTSGLEILELVCRALGRPFPSLKVDPSLCRPADDRSVCGDASRLIDATGWEPTVSVAQSIADYARWRSGPREGRK